MSDKSSWQPLPLSAWADTCATLHMWTPIVGKIRLALAPRVNHWWHVPLYVTARGLTTSRIPDRDRSFEIAFDQVIGAGFWPGGGAATGPALYAYAAPEPPGFRAAAILPAAATYNVELGEFILMYDDVRTAESPPRALLDFLQSTYEAGADLGKWDRAALERTA